uniref:CCDC66 domain-containing protein n=1 Tax=Strongyloides stercoralis TaxID=6248 RepID=A0A0K0DS06_STRER
MVRTYNWNPSTQTNVKLGDNLYNNANNKYENSHEKILFNDSIKNSHDLIDAGLSKINSTNYISQNNSLYPPLKTTTTLSNNSSFSSIQDKNNYLPSTLPYKSGIIDDKEKISLKNPLDISWDVPPEILEGRTFIVGMKAYSINGNIMYKPFPVKNIFSSLINEHEENNKLNVDIGSLNINNQKMEYTVSNKINEENYRKIFEVERGNDRNYYENKFLPFNTNEDMYKIADYTNDQKLPILNNGRYINNTSLNEENVLKRNSKAIIPGFNDKERLKYELLQQIEENRRRKEMEKYKEWEMEEKRRIRDEMYFEKQRQLMKEEELQSKLKMEMVQKKAEAIAARASELSKNHLNVKKKYSHNEKRLNIENDDDISKKKTNDGYNIEDKSSLKSVTSHSLRSTSSSSPPKQLEWWETKKINQTNVRSTTTSPPIPVLRKKVKDENNIGINNKMTNYEDTYNNSNLITNNYENEANNVKLEKREQSISSTKSQNLSATAESLQRQIRLTNPQQILT